MISKTGRGEAGGNGILFRNMGQVFFTLVNPGIESFLSPIFFDISDKTGQQDLYFVYFFPLSFQTNFMKTITPPKAGPVLSGTEYFQTRPGRRKL